MKYLLLFCRDPQDAEAWEALPEETRAQQETRVRQWLAEHRSQIRSDHQLHPPYTTTTVHFTPNSRPLITDGPFFSGTEVLGGYAEIEVTDLDEALQLVKTWPGRSPAPSVIEIRPLDRTDRARYPYCPTSARTGDVEKGRGNATGGDSSTDATVRSLELCQWARAHGGRFAFSSRVAGATGLPARTGVLRPGLSLEEAADIVWALSSYELYRMLVVERGWEPARYETWLAQILIQQLLQPGDE